jgi:hypothetical protein
MPTPAEAVEQMEGSRGAGREQAYKEGIERMIDKQGVSGLLDLVGEVCREKQGHFEEHGGKRDPDALKWWAAAVHIEHASNKITMSGL